MADLFGDLPPPSSGEFSWGRGGGGGGDALRIADYSNCYAPSLTRLRDAFKKLPIRHFPCTNSGTPSSLFDDLPPASSTGGAEGGGLPRKRRLAAPEDQSGRTKHPKQLGLKSQRCSVSLGGCGSL